MPRGASGTAWFEDLFGFRESGSFSDNQAHFRMEGETLVCDSAPKHKRHFVGRWTTPSLSELREELAASNTDGAGGSLRELIQLKNYGLSFCIEKLLEIPFGFCDMS